MNKALRRWHMHRKNRHWWVLTILLLAGGGIVLFLNLKEPADEGDPIILYWSMLQEGFSASLSPSSPPGATAMLKQMEGKQVRLNGYMFPLQQAEEHSQFLFSPRTHACPFCMPSNAGNIIEVRMQDALPLHKQPIEVQGRFVLLDTLESDGLLYRIEDGKLFETAP